MIITNGSRAQDKVSRSQSAFPVTEAIDQSYLLKTSISALVRDSTAVICIGNQLLYFLHVNLSKVFMARDGAPEDKVAPQNHENYQNYEN